MTHGYEIWLEAALWGSLIGLFYTYLGYPLLLALWSARETKAVTRQPITPMVSIVIAARNEGRRLPARIKNCLEQQYPDAQLDIVVVSDGPPDDDTRAAIRKFDPSRVTLIGLDMRRGKAMALNAGVLAAKGAIVVFTDARQRFALNAVAELVSNFADPLVGAVSGELILETPPGRPGADGIGLYWRIEKWIRRKESAIDSVVGTTGAIYAIRRELFQPLPEGTILDDVVIPMRIAMQGYRVVFEPRAQAFDLVEAHYRTEFNRKVRTLAGNYQAIRLCPALMNPWRNRIFLQFVSHKVWRLAAPFSLMALFVTNLTLLGGWHSHLFAAQVAGYGMAIIGWRLNRRGIRERWTTAAYTFCLLNIAALVGAIRFVRGDVGAGLWDGTDRVAGGDDIWPASGERAAS